MNPKVKVLITISLLLPIVISQSTVDTSEVRWYSMPPDEIQLNTYQSPNKVDPNAKPNYMDWVDIRNAFRYDPDEPPIAKLVPYFTPENDGYYGEAFEFGYFFVGCAILMGAAIIVYLVMRFVLHGCQGPKNQKNMEGDDKMKWILTIVGGVIALTAMIIMLILSKKQ